MSGMLDLVIGVSFLYLLLSLIVTTINEIIAALWNSRGIYLISVIRGLVEDSKVAEALESHSLVKSIVNSRLPSYIPSKAFALALLDSIDKLGAAKTRVAADVEGALNRIQNPALKEALLPLYADAKGDIDEFINRLEEWFNGGMERAHAWYKRNTQYWTLAIAGLLVVTLNADTIRISRALSSDSGKRELVVEQARRYLDSMPCTADQATDRSDQSAASDDAQLGADQLSRLMNELTLQLPVGWTERDWTDLRRAGVPGWVLWLLGSAITVLAVSLGAPFWFDILSKIANVRFNGKPPREAKSSQEQ